MSLVGALHFLYHYPKLAVLDSRMKRDNSEREGDAPAVLFSLVRGCATHFVLAIVEDTLPFGISRPSLLECRFSLRDARDLVVSPPTSSRCRVL